MAAERGQEDSRERSETKADEVFRILSAKEKEALDRQFTTFLDRGTGKWHWSTIDENRSARRPRWMEFARTKDSAADFWRDCESGSDLLWMCTSLAKPPRRRKRRRLTFCASQCVRQALPHAGTAAASCETVLSIAEKWATQGLLSFTVTVGDLERSVELLHPFIGKAGIPEVVYAALSTARIAAYPRHSPYSYAAEALAHAAAAFGAQRQVADQRFAKVVRSFFPVHPPMKYADRVRK